MATRIFHNAWFRRFRRKQNISDAAMIEAVSRAESGLIDVDLGGDVIKQRIARSGQGRAGGYRTIIVFKRADKAFFVYGFAKSDRQNVASDELAAFKRAAEELLALSEIQIQALVSRGTLTEIEVDR